MTPAERERDVARFDKPIDLDTETRPLTARERARWERAMKQKPHVSIFVGKGATKVEINLDDDLLADVRKFARKNKTSLPKMIDKGLRGLIAFG